MNRPILITALLLVAVFATERYIARRIEADRVLKGRLRPLPGHAQKSAESVRAFRIARADTAWAYRMEKGNWIYPADHNAFALNDRINAFLRDIVESRATVVSIGPKPEFGFDAAPLTVHLADSAGIWAPTIWIGASLPGLDTREAYVKIPQSDTVYQIHADPIRVLHSARRPGRPPFIDPKILPSALARRGVKEVVYHAPGHPVQKLERVEIAPDKIKKSPQDGPVYEWYATVSNRQKKAVSAPVYAYLGFLSRMTYKTLHDPSRFSESTASLILIDDQNAADTLEIGAQTGDGATYIRHKTTGYLYAIPNDKAALLFPTPALLDTLPNPSPYEQAEPSDLPGSESP